VVAARPTAHHRVAMPHRGRHAVGVAVVDTEIRANRRRAVALAVGAGAVPALLVAAVLAGVGDPVAAGVAFVVVAAVTAIAIWRLSTSVVVGMIGARPLRAEECPRLANLLENLCATFGLRPPRLMLVDDPLPNACTLGRTPHDAVLVVTTGLLERLDLMSLEGVVAHELVHVRRHDTVVAGVAATVLAPVARFTGDDRWLHRALGVGREYRADQVAVATVRYPPGLHGALATIAASPAPAPGSLFGDRRLAATRWLWIDPLVARGPAVGTSGGSDSSGSDSSGSDGGGSDRGSSDGGGIDALEVRIGALAEW